MTTSIRSGRVSASPWCDVSDVSSITNPIRLAQGLHGVCPANSGRYTFSDGQIVGQTLYQRIQTFSKRQKRTYAQVKSLIGQALKQIDLSAIRVLCIEDLKQVRHHKRGTFPRTLNRRLSHWLYGYTVEVLARHCEQHGVKLERKNPAYTSQFCRHCRRWDRRSRVRERFRCVHCGFSVHADLNAARNLALLGEAGVYGLRSLPSLA